MYNILVCAKNLYGPRCALTCGSCSNKETCHNIDGTCPHGCDDGVYGEQCQKGKQFRKMLEIVTVTRFIAILYMNFILLFTEMRKFINQATTW